MFFEMSMFLRGIISTNCRYFSGLVMVFKRINRNKYSDDICSKMSDDFFWNRIFVKNELKNKVNQSKN